MKADECAVLDGAALAKRIQEEIKPKVAAFVAAAGPAARARYRARRSRSCIRSLRSQQVEGGW